MWNLLFFIFVNVSISSYISIGVTGGYIPPGPKFKCPKLNQIWPCVCLSSNDNGISLRCEDVSLATLSAGLAHVARTQTPIEILHIRKLNAKTLFGPLLENQNITKLVIENTAATRILSDFLYEIRKTLKDFQLLNSNIKEYSNTAFQALKNLESLTLDGHQIYNLTLPITGLDGLKALRISNGNVSILSKSTFSSLRGLQRLDLHANQLTDLPKDALQQQKSLEFFDISFNKFSKLDPGYFNHLTKLTWFNGSHNQIPEFKRGAFARNNFLRVIHLTHNKISKLDATTLRGMRLLRRLYLSDNLIVDIGRSTFDAINKIGTIDLSRNRLSVVDYQLFSGLTQAEFLDVSQNVITDVKKEAFKDLSYVAINMSHNEISRFDKDSFVNCVNITVLDLSHNRIDNFTRGTFDDFSYPTELRLEFNLLPSLGNVPLKAFHGLKILNASYNELEEVPKNTFPKLYELHTLDLSHNNISKVHAAIFTSLFSLRHLDMSFNNMSQVRGSTFGTIPTLIGLTLKHNVISVISPAAFTQLASLRHLDVSDNKLKSVFQISGSLSSLDVSNNEITSLAKAWPVMNALLRLNLNGNQLGGNLDGGSFSGLGTLQEIKLEQNNLSEVPIEALSSLTIVQRIDLADNSITTLKKVAFGRLPVLFNLDLSNNKVDTIEQKAFDGLLQLQTLNLSRNNISTLVVGCFSSLVSLKVLNLSHNFIERTENGTQCVFEENLSLETLDISHNRFSSVKALTFPSKEWTSYRLLHVDLSHNFLVSITKDFLRGTKTLVDLNLSFNTISDIRPSVFGNLSNLATLDLSYNNIGILDSAAIGPPPNLRELKLQGNRLRKFPVEVLQKAPFLVLNLTANAIPFLDAAFVTKIQNGSRILLNQNPIACDCRFVPLVRFFEEFRQKLSNNSALFYKDYLQAECISKTSKAAIRLQGLSDSQLVCDSTDYLAPIISPKKELEIRRVETRQNIIQIVWSVVTSKAEMSGFQLTLEDSKKQSLWTRVFSYNVRSAQLQPVPGMTSICIRSTALLVEGGPTSGSTKECQAFVPEDFAAISIFTVNSAEKHYHITMLTIIAVTLNFISYEF